MENICVLILSGSYGIQAMGGVLVKGIRGDFYNVVGFPVHHFARVLSEVYAH